MEDYKVIRAIGKGSFGKVYLVKHATEGRSYVMKVIKLKGIPPKEREACRNEVMLMKRLAHPNIVAYKDSFFANGKDSLCIVMTYCDGGDLAARLAANKSQLFKEDQIMHWFVQIALAIHYMHENNVLHRDIKTQNIFLLGNGRLVLGDLGISKVLDGTMAFAKTQIGTPYYMSPELFRSAPYAHKSDVWALGCVLYELCTLQHPFEATSLHGLAQKIMAGRYTPINAKYSQSLRALIASMLSQSPTTRPSLGEVLQQAYIKKHVYNFIKDIADRSAVSHTANAALGPLGVPPPSSSVADGPIGEGTMMFKAAALRVAGAGGAASATDAMAKAIAAGLGPHANNLQQQLVKLGLQPIVLKALEDAAGGSLASAPPPPPPAVASSAAVAVGSRASAAAPISAAAPVSSRASVAPSVSSAGSNPTASAAVKQVVPGALLAGPAGAAAAALAGVRPAIAVAAPAPIVAPAATAAAPPAYDAYGRPLTPRAAKRMVKESQAALEREEERKRAAEAALARLKEEKELRAKQREEFRRKQERMDLMQQQQKAAGLPARPSAPPAGANRGMGGVGLGMGGPGAGGGGALAGLQPGSNAKQPSSSAAAAANAGYGIGGSAAAKAAAAGMVAGARAGAGAGGAVAVGQPAPQVVYSAAPSAAAAGAKAGGGSSNSSVLSAASRAAAAEAEKEKAEQLKARAAAIRKQAEDQRRARLFGLPMPAAPSILSAQPSVESIASGNSNNSNNSRPQSAGGAAAMAAPASSAAEQLAAARRAEAERKNVADLERWEKDNKDKQQQQQKQGGAKAVLPVGAPLPSSASSSAAAAPPSYGLAAKKPSPAPAPVASSAAAAAAPVVVPVGGGLPPRSSAAAGSGSGPAPVVPSLAAAPAPALRRDSSSSASSAPSSSASAGGSSSARASSVVVVPVGSSAAAAAANKGGSQSARSASPSVAPSSSSSSSSSPAQPSSSSSSSSNKPSPSALLSNIGMRDSADLPTPAAVLAQASNLSWESFLPASSPYDALSARDKVLLRKEAERKVEAERQRLVLYAAALEQHAERKRAQYQARDQYRGVGAAIASHLPIHEAVLNDHAADATALIDTLQHQAAGIRASFEMQQRQQQQQAKAAAVAGVAANAKPSSAGELPSSSSYDQRVPARDAAADDAVLAAGYGDGDAADVDGHSHEDGHYAVGELPDTDSEDSVILEACRRSKEDAEDNDEGDDDGGDDDDDDNDDGATTVSSEEGEGAQVRRSSSVPQSGAPAGKTPSTVVSVKRSAPTASAASPPRRGEVAPAVPGPVASRHVPVGARPPARAGGPRSSGARKIGLSTGEEDDTDIKQAEEELKAELMRSTMRCNGLRASLEVVRKMAVDAGVHMHSSHAASNAAAAAGANFIGGLHAASRPISGASAIAAAALGGGNPLIAASRPISAALPSTSTSIPVGAPSSAGAAYPPPPLPGSNANARPSISIGGGGAGSGSTRDERPIRPSPSPHIFGVLPPSRYENAAAAAQPEAAAAAPALSAAPAGKAGAVSASAAPEVMADEDEDGVASIHTNTASTSSYDEDDIGDEDGDVEGGVSFKGDLASALLANPALVNNGAAMGGAGAALPGDAIPEADDEDEEATAQDEEDDDEANDGDAEDDDDDDIYGLMDYSGLNINSNNSNQQPGSSALQQQGSGGASASISVFSAGSQESVPPRGVSAASTNSRAPSDFKGIDIAGAQPPRAAAAVTKAAAPSGTSSFTLSGSDINTTITSTSASNPAPTSTTATATATTTTVVGSLSERVDTYRRICIQGLGEALFESTYEAVKEALFGGEMGMGMEGDEEVDAAAAIARIASTMQGGKGGHYLPYIEALVHMEEQLL